MYSTLLWDEPIAIAPRYGPCLLRDHTATHSQTIPEFTPQLQTINTLWLVLTVPTHKGMARLSWVAGYIISDNWRNPNLKLYYQYTPQTTTVGGFVKSTNRQQRKLRHRK